MQLDTAPIRPAFQRSGLEFRPMIDGDGARSVTVAHHPIEDRTSPASECGGSSYRPWSESETDAHWPRHHARNPCSTVPGGPWGRASVPGGGRTFSPANPHAKLQFIQRIQPAHLLVIDPPAFTPEQHPDALVAEPGPRMSQIAEGELRRGLILHPTELSRLTGPYPTHLKRPLKPLGQFPQHAVGKCRGPRTAAGERSDDEKIVRAAGYRRREIGKAIAVRRLPSGKRRVHRRTHVLAAERYAY